MTEPSTIFDGVLPPDNNEEVLWFITKVKEFPLPLMTDKYFINDIIYYVFAEFLQYYSERGFKDVYLPDGMWDYLDSVLEFEDVHLLNDIADGIVKEAREILISNTFSHFYNSKDIIENVQYRYDHTEQYVRWYITVGRSC